MVSHLGSRYIYICNMSSLVGILNAPNRLIYILKLSLINSICIIEGAASFSETDRLYTKIGVERDGTPFICLEFKGMQISVIYMHG